MNVWRVIAGYDHDYQEAVLAEFRKRQIIALGWGLIGDMRNFVVVNYDTIYRRISTQYKGSRLASPGIGAPCLNALFNEMKHGDRVIIATQRGREAVVTIDDDLYEYQEQNPVYDDICHVRKILWTNDDPYKLRPRYKAASGWNLRWPLVKLV